MATTDVLSLTRAQLQTVSGDDVKILKTVEEMISRSNEIPSLQDGNDANTIGLATLSDLVRPITINPIQPLTAAIGADTTYTLTAAESTEGVKMVYIPTAFLAASAGGPWNLTITSGAGTSEVVVISESTATILSGALVFDIRVDASKNVIAKDWTYKVLDTLGEGIRARNGRRYPSLVDDSRITTGTIARNETVANLEIGQTALINWACGITGGVARIVTFALPDVPAVADTYEVNLLTDQNPTSALSSAVGGSTLSSWGSVAGGSTFAPGAVNSGNSRIFSGYVKRIT